jgi:hypothetical protein
LADLTANLKPISDENVLCLDRDEAISCHVNYEENKDCHAQLKSASSNIDWVSVILIGTGTLMTGFIIGQATK